MAENKPKPKFGARMVRATASGMPISFLFFVVNYFFSTAVNILAKSSVLDPIAFGIFGFALGLSGAVATEISKDLES